MFSSYLLGQIVSSIIWGDIYSCRYAKNETEFFRDFALAFGKLLALGCPANAQPNYHATVAAKDKMNAAFRELVPSRAF